VAEWQLASLNFWAWQFFENQYFTRWCSNMIRSRGIYNKRLCCKFPSKSVSLMLYITTTITIFGWPFVKRFALSYLTVVCLSFCLSCPVLSVCDIGVLWPNGCTDQDETKLGMQLGLGPGRIVLDGDPAPPKRGTAPSPNFRPMCIAAKRLHASVYHLVHR